MGLSVLGAVLLGAVLAIPAADALVSGSAPAAVPARPAAPPSPAPRTARPPAEERAAPDERTTLALDQAVVVRGGPGRAPRARRPSRVQRPAAVASASDEPTGGSEPATERGPDPAAERDDPARTPREELRETMLELHELLPDLAAEDVQRVVRNQRPRMQRCYTRALRRAGAAQEARVTLTVDVGPQGSVDHVTVEGDRVTNLHGCLRELAGRWIFPRSRGGARVPIPLSFTTAD